MGTLSYLAPAPSPVPSSRVLLRQLARLDVEQAREFLTELDSRTEGADLSRAMYLLGQLQGHAESLLDVLDTATEVS